MNLDKEILGNKKIDCFTWDEFFMSIAKLATFRSKDPSTQVGACIVNNHNRILSIGYNGTPNNFDDDNFPWDREGSTRNNTKYPYVCHAELNAILNYYGSRKDFVGSRIYVSLFPCNECAKLIIQAGITEVVYLSDKYYDTEEIKSAKMLFNSCGISYRKLDKESQKIIRLSLKDDDEIQTIKE